MARDRDKIEAFKILLGDDFAHHLAPYQQDLSQLQIGDDDEANAQAIETWLATRPPLNQAYQNELTTLTADNPLLEETTEMKGVGGSEANTKASTLKELLDNAQKRNTPPPPKTDKT